MKAGNSLFFGHRFLLCVGFVFFAGKAFAASSKTLGYGDSFVVLDLEAYNSAKKLSPLSRLKWYHNKKQWKNCVKTAEGLTEDHSLGVWVSATHLDCMQALYKTTRGLKVNHILDLFEKLEVNRDLLLKSAFLNHKKKLVRVFLDLSDLASKHAKNRLDGLIDRNRDLIDFMDPEQRERYQRLLGQPLLLSKTKKKEKAKKGETQLWNRFSKAFRKKQWMKAADYGSEFLNRFPDSRRQKTLLNKVARLHKSLLRRRGKKWRTRKDKFEKKLLKAPVEAILFWASRAYDRGYRDSSLYLAENLMERGDGGAFVPEILLLAGRSAYDQALFSKAKAHFQNLIKNHGKHKASQEARYRLGLLHYRQAEYRELISIYEPFLKTPGSDPWELQVRYWLWRSLKKVKPAKAGDIAEILFKKFPLTYYGMIVRMEEKKSLQSLVSKEAKKLESARWDTGGTEEQWERIERLLKYGWIREAELEIDTMPEPRSAQGFIVRAKLWYSTFLFYRSIKDYASVVDMDLQYLSFGFLEKTFPRFYKRDVIKAEREFSVSRYLIWSIMRQESAFMAKAISPNRAYGLMQLLGSTARETARWLKVKGFRRQDVFKPRYNIRFGAHYFLRMFRKYKRMGPMAIASYNVGPGNLDRWLKQRHDLGNPGEWGESLDEDLWMDELPWTETSFYVKAVLRNYLLYRVVYDKKDQLDHPPWMKIYIDSD